MIAQSLAGPPMIIVDIKTTEEAKKFSVYERMANAVVALTRKNDDCLPQDLLTLGFNKNETFDNWAMA